MSLLVFELKSAWYFFRGYLLTALGAVVVIFIGISLNDVINVSPFWSNILSKSFVLAIAVINIMGWFKTIKFVKENEEKVIVQTERGKRFLSSSVKATIFFCYAFSIVLGIGTIGIIFG